MTAPARRVIYRSLKARIARFATGVSLMAVTLWIVLPVVGSEHPPPPPVGLAIGTNSDTGRLRNDPHAYASIIYLNVTTTGCHNPATIEGTLIRSKATEKAELETRGAALPKQAIVTIDGARVRDISVGLSNPPPYPVLFTGTEGFIHQGDYGKIAIRNHTLPSTYREGATTTVLEAPEWPTTKATLHFIAKVDLIRPAAFHSCYLELPELLNGEIAKEDGAYEWASVVNDLVGHRLQRLLAKHLESGFEEAVGAGEIQASVGGRTVAQDTIGAGGEATAAGVRYLCHDEIEKVLPPRLDPKIARPFIEPAKSDCSGEPLFQAVDVVNDITRRLFAGGILGAIAVSLIIETLFIAETELKDNTKGNPPADTTTHGVAHQVSTLGRRLLVRRRQSHKG